MKKIAISIVLIIVLLVAVMYGFNYKSAAADNVYSIQTDATSLKLNDEFTITIEVECNTTLNSVQGRIDLGNDVELVDGENSCVFTDFTYEYKNGLRTTLEPTITVSDGIVIFSITGNSDLATGTKQFLTLNLKVVGSTQSNVEIKWQGRNKSGFYDIASVSIPRTDVDSSSDGQSSSDSGYVTIDGPSGGDTEDVSDEVTVDSDYDEDSADESVSGSGYSSGGTRSSTDSEDLSTSSGSNSFLSGNYSANNAQSGDIRR